MGKSWCSMCAKSYAVVCLKCHELTIESFEKENDRLRKENDRLRKENGKEKRS